MGGVVWPSSQAALSRKQFNQWTGGDGVVEFVSSTHNGDGTTTEVYRSAVPLDTEKRGFMRLRITER